MPARFRPRGCSKLATATYDTKLDDDFQTVTSDDEEHERADGGALLGAWW